MGFISRWNEWMGNQIRALLLAIGLLGLRVAGGGLMLLGHGWAKLQNFSSLSESFPDPLGVGSFVSVSLAIFAEFFCAAAVVLGVATRLAAVPLIVTMGVALLIVHAEDPWKVKELSCLYGLLFCVILLTGPGPLSLDHLFWGRKAKDQK